MNGKSNVPDFNPKVKVVEFEREWQELPIDEIYLIMVLNAEPRESQFKDEDGNAKIDLLWSLEVEEPDEYQGRQITYWTPSVPSRNPRTGKPNKLLAFIQALVSGEVLKKGVEVDLSGLTGKTCRVTLVNKQLRDGRNWQAIGSIIPNKKKKEAKDQKVKKEAKPVTNKEKAKGIPF